MSAQITATEDLAGSGRAVRYTMSSQAGLATFRGPVRMAVTDTERADEAALRSKGDWS